MVAECLESSERKLVLGLDHCAKEVVFASEVIVERALRDASCSCDLIETNAGIAPAAKLHICSIENGLPCLYC